MEKFQVAHFQEQGQQIIVVFVNRQFGHKSQAEQNDICSYLQACATSAGLAGTVVPVWDAGGNRMGFLAPQPWQPFFRSVSLGQLAANINRELTCQ
jgi:hypothetical protein